MTNKNTNLIKQLSLAINEIDTYLDLIECVSIFQRKEPRECKAYIHVELVKLSIRLDVELSADRAKIITEDIYDLYGHESLEDIKYCFKLGSEGVYGNHYNKLSMNTICEWMAKHLDKKAMERNVKELENPSNIHQWKDRKEYLEAVKIGDLVQKNIKKKKNDQQKKIHQKEHNYQKFKSDYLKEQSKIKRKLQEVLNK